jgi:hypothetical protein
MAAALPPARHDQESTATSEDGTGLHSMAGAADGPASAAGSAAATAMAAEEGGPATHGGELGERVAVLVRRGSGAAWDELCGRIAALEQEEAAVEQALVSVRANCNQARAGSARALSCGSFVQGRGRLCIPS